MKVKALKSFGGLLPNGERIHVSEGTEFELPEGVDWLKASLVVPVRGEKKEKAVIEAPEKAVPYDYSASSAAAELAAKHGIDLAKVEGTGAEGNILKSDVEKVLEED